MRAKFATLLSVLCVTAFASTYTSSTDGFSANFPTTPQLQSMNFNQSGFALKLNNYQSTTKDIVSIVSIVNFNKPMDPTTKSQFEKGFISSFLKTSGCTVTSQTSAKYAGKTGKRLGLKKGTATGMTWYTFLPRKMIVVTAVRSSGSSKANIYTLANSLKLK